MTRSATVILPASVCLYDAMAVPATTLGGISLPEIKTLGVSSASVPERSTLCIPVGSWKETVLRR